MSKKALGVVVAVGLIAAAGAAGPRSEAAGCGPAREFRSDVPELTVDPAKVVWSMTVDEATFSSPRAVDLTGDGVLDVVQGFGQDTLGERESSAVATNGATGEQLWRSTGHEDLIGSAVFASLGGDDTIDVVIGGRRGELVALDGATGSRLWQFDDQSGRWFNFYTTQVVPDQDGDGIDDFFAVNGGLVFDEPAEGGGVPDPDKRNLGTMFVISGADGAALASMPVPDRRESYMSPVVLPAGVSGDVDVLVGTGGETLSGSLWRLPLDAIAARDVGQAEQLVDGVDKGVIASPVVADTNGDCVADFVVQAFDGSLTLIDGASGDQLWVVANAGFETYSTPALGYFVGDDDVPDVFASVARGVWPEYESSDYLLIDGATGALTWRETLGTFAPSGFVAADLNGDGRDEVIFGVNDVGANTLQMYVFEPSRLALHPLGDPFAQTSFSAPWLGDLDGNGWLDLVVTESAYQPPTTPAIVRRVELGWRAPAVVSWGAYLGTTGTGLLAYADSQS